MGSPITKRLAAIGKAIRERDAAEASEQVGGALQDIAAREETAVQVMAVGGDPVEALAFIDKLVTPSSLTTHEDARRLVVGRIARGEPVMGLV